MTADERAKLKAQCQHAINMATAQWSDREKSITSVLLLYLGILVQDSVKIGHFDASQFAESLVEACAKLQPHTKQNPLD